MSIHRLPLLALSLAALLAGCYSQQPLSTLQPTPAMRITALLTDTGRVVMENRIGAGARDVEGVVAAADANTWDLHLTRVSYIGGTSVIWNRELVSFPRFTLRDPREKRLDRTKSWATAGAIAVGAFLATKVLGGLSGDDAINDGTPPPAN